MILEVQFLAYIDHLPTFEIPQDWVDTLGGGGGGGLYLKLGKNI